MRIVFVLLAAAVIANACRSPMQEVHEVDFANGEIVEDPIVEDPATIRVAIATVISPRESFVYYQEMFEAMSAQLGRRVEFKQRPTYAEVNDMLAQNLIDIAFVCSGAYIQGDDHMELLVVPLVDGQPYYRGYIIAHKDSPVAAFEDFRGMSFTHSDPMCFTGSLFVESRLSELGTVAGEFFNEVVYSLSHDLSIQMVARKIVDGAAVNGLIFEYFKKYRPEYVEDIKVVDTTSWGGIPPVVNSLLMPRPLREEVRDFFLGMHLGEETRQILDNLLIERFLIVGDTLYDDLREIKGQ